MIKILKTSDNKILRKADGSILRRFIPDYYIVYNGLLYNWPITQGTGGSSLTSSDDWAVATYSDFDALITYLGGSSLAGHKLREVTTNYWNNINFNTNESGFNGRGGGYRDLSNGTFNNLKAHGMYLTSTASFGGYCYMLQLPDSGNATLETGVGTKGHKKTGLSVRLIYTGAGTPTSYTDNSGNVYRVVTINGKIYLADNLAETRFRDGSIIPWYGADAASYFTNAEWAALTTAGCCAYDNDPANVAPGFSFPTP